MIIYTLWHRGDDDDDVPWNVAPWIVDAVDEYTVDNCGFPPEYLKSREDAFVRELIIDVPEAVVRALFQAPIIKAVVKQAAAELPDAVLEEKSNDPAS